MRKNLNHAISLVIVVPLLIFLFYKSVNSSYPYQQLETYINALDELQVELHRDILRYRNHQIRQYDTLNKSIETIEAIAQNLAIPASHRKNPVIVDSINRLKKTIDGQSELVEDFKTHNAVVQNSLLYFARLHDEIYGNTDTLSPDPDDVSAILLGRLSTLILEYSRKPDHATALKIFPLLDKLNVNPDERLKTLINHSLIIIERLPRLDALIVRFGDLDVEQQIGAIRQELSIVKAQLENHNRVYNGLLLFCSLYLVSYIAYVLYALRLSKIKLEKTNTRLSKEVHERTKTERTLFNLVKETVDVNRDDMIHGVLRALRSSLGVRYAYVSLHSENEQDDTLTMYLIDNGQYRKDITYVLEDSPCQEVMNRGRLAHNRDLQNYFMEWEAGKLPQAESYIGIALKSSEEKPIGVIAIADDKPIENTNLAENVLTLMASRTLSELSRSRAMSDSNRYNNGLELIDKWTLELVSSASDESEFYEKVCAASREIADATMALIPLLEPNGDFYSFVSASGHNAERMIGARLPVNDGCLCGWSMQNRQDARIDDVTTDIRARRQLTNQFNVATAYVTPIYLDNNVVGAITVFRDSGCFDDIDVQLINQFAQHVQFAIKNMELVRNIAEEKERAEVTLHSIGDAVITTDADGRIDYMNHIAQEMTGWRLKKVLREPVQTVFRILDIDTREPMHNVIDACLTDGTVIQKSLLILIENNGDERDIECSMSPIRTGNGNIEGAVVVFHDESDKRQLHDHIQHKATHDSLTGLINRHEFETRLKNHIFHAQTHESLHSLCFLDLDHFKQVNDCCGHDAGDEILKKVASLLQNAIRHVDTIGRLGGDEFGLVLENCGITKAKSIAKNIISKITATRFEWDNRQFEIGVSIGIVAIDARTTGLNEALKQADVACYTAKENGRNQAYIYTQQDGELLRRGKELQWSSRITDGIEKGRFKLFAQPVCPLIDKDKKHFVEILARMLEPSGTSIAPSTFIQAAERYNVIDALDQHIIREVFRFIAETGISDSVGYSINLSSRSITGETFPTFIRQSVAEYGIKPELICFEITESAAISNLARTKHLIDALKPMGIRFALDDFGSSLSSVGYLKNLPVDMLKIDGSFVRDMADNRIDYAMVAAINEIAHIMNLETVAEFAENDSIIGSLHAIGVDYAQGYGIARPAPLDAVIVRDAAERDIIPGHAV